VKLESTCIGWKFAFMTFGKCSAAVFHWWRVIIDLPQSFPGHAATGSQRLRRHPQFAKLTPQREFSVAQSESSSEGVSSIHMASILWITWPACRCDTALMRSSYMSCVFVLITITAASRHIPNSQSHVQAERVLMMKLSRHFQA